MLPLVFYYILEGAIVAFYVGFLYKIVDSSIPFPENTHKDQNIKTAYVFIVLGCGEFVGGITSGMLADRLRLKQNCRVNRFFLSSVSTNIV